MTYNRPARQRRRRGAGMLTPLLFSAPFVITYLVFGIAPMIYSFALSLTDWNGISEPVFIGLQNYAALLRDGFFFQSVVNVFILTGIGFTSTMLIALLLAFLLQNHRIPGARAFQFINFYPYITTPVAIGFIWSMLFDWNYGTINQMLVSIGLLSEPVYWLGSPATARFVIISMGIWKYTGYTMMFLTAAMLSIDTSVVESALIDGASKIQTFLRIQLPMIKHTLLFVYLTSIIGGFQQFDEPMQLFRGGFGSSQPMGGPMNSALTMSVYLYQTAFKNLRYGYGSALAWGIFVVIAAFAFSNLRMLLREDRL